MEDGRTTSGGPASAAERHLVVLHHPVHIAAVALWGLALSVLFAAQDPPPRWELDVTTWLNDAPDAVATALWPLMQFGSLFGPAVVALVLLAWRRDWRLSLVCFLSGVVAWYAAKGVKSLVGRGRPLQYLADVHVREGAGGGLGYVSGHSAVSASIAMFVVACTPPRWRWLPVAGALGVGVSRIVYGMHLPADVIGGWSIGVLIAVVGLELYRRWTKEETNDGP